MSLRNILVSAGDPIVRGRDVTLNDNLRIAWAGTHDPDYLATDELEADLVDRLGGLVEFGMSQIQTSGRWMWAWGGMTAARTSTDPSSVIQFVTPGRLDLAKANVEVAPGVGQSTTFTVYQGTTIALLGATALAAVVTDANLTGDDLVDSLTILAGDVVGVLVTYTGAKPVTSKLSLRFVATP